MATVPGENREKWNEYIEEVYDKEVYDKEVYDKEVYDKEVYDKEVYDIDAEPREIKTKKQKEVQRDDTGPSLLVSKIHEELKKETLKGLVEFQQIRNFFNEPSSSCYNNKPGSSCTKTVLNIIARILETSPIGILVLLERFDVWI